MTRRSGLRRACASGFRSANLMDAHAGPRSPQTVTTGYPAPLGQATPQTRGPERLGLSELGPGRVYPFTKEPTGLLRTDGRRPDGQTLFPWRGGKNLVWDATVTDTLAASYLPDTSLTAGAAAERASTRKTEKYSELSSTHLFTPLALETLGPINCEGLSFLSELGQKLRATTGEMRETAFLFQRISITIQRFNAVAFRGTFSGQDPDVRD